MKGLTREVGDYFQTSDKMFSLESLALRVAKKRHYYFDFNSKAVGMTVGRPYGFEIDFVRNLVSGSAA